MNPIKNRIRIMVKTLNSLRYSDSIEVKNFMVSPGTYEFGEVFKQEGLSFRPFGADETWGGKDKHYWFFTSVTLPVNFKGSQVRAVLHTGAADIWNTDNPQVMVYVNGKLSGTMDMNHRDFILTLEAAGGETYELAFYAYSNSPAHTNFFHLKIARYHEEAARFYYDLKVPFEAADLLEDDDLEQIDACKILLEAVNKADLSKPFSDAFFSSLKDADDWLLKTYYKKRSENPVTVHSIGHTHIDVAWKWPLKQTRQKAVRSFRTVLNLMDRYPEYKFMSSQPQLYEFVQEETPELFHEIKKKVKEGRWEPEGAMWLEPDCNLVSGESLIRQILYGRRFFEKELEGSANEVLWLPDVFGYSAAIPQIMKQSGLSYFMTTKLGWNEYNQFPYDTFRWRGIDGSEVLTYLISTRDYQKKDEPFKGFSTTYNGMQNASQIMGTWQRYQNKDVSKEVLTCYGYGDGGGGPTEEMLEQSRRMEYSVARCPKTRQTFVKDFFHTLEERMDTKRLPVWSGELYLEFHRGTYTSMAENKKYNRQCEFLNGDAEFYAVLNLMLNKDAKYPAKTLEENWKLLLLNQFHDILPGSSIKEVYEDSKVQYEQLLKSDKKIIDNSRSQILKALGYEKEHKKGNAIAVWNSLSFARTGIVKLPHPVKESCLLTQETYDGKVLCLVPEAVSKGVRVFENTPDQAFPNESSVFSISQTDDQGRPVKVMTSYYEVDFDSNGNMQRLYDRKEERSLFKEGMLGNQLLAFDDRPLEYDAWNIDSTYEEKVWTLYEAEEVKLVENGPVRGCILVKRRFMDSEIEQRICFYKHTARIDFQTRILWNQHQMLLKAEFPLDLLCREANYDIQFGNVSRPTHKNTSWDKARFEVCAHKWADVSEPGYGAALLNDCKYGYDVQDSIIRLTLLKSGIFPNPDADQGEHTFTYSLYPHSGDFRTGRVVQEAYDLNISMQAAVVNGKGPDSYSFLEIQEENILADTVKLSEEGEEIVVRFYETYGKRTKAHVRFPHAVEAAFTECNCMEEERQPLAGRDGELELLLKPYEIKTIKIRIP